MKSNKLTVTTIILIAIGIVAGPLIAKGLRQEIAHWYLAAGSNAVELGTGDATREIELARQWYPELDELEDYWLLRIKQANATSPEAMLELVRTVPKQERLHVAMRVANDLYAAGEYGAAAEAYTLAFGTNVDQNEDYWQLRVMEAYQQQSPQAAVIVMGEAMESNPRFGPLVYRYSQALADRLEFDAALQALSLVFESDSKDSSVLNQFAYYRALARVDLDKALIDINKALNDDENEPALRDTRAWVYYQLERYEEALEDADFAVQAMQRLSVTNLLNRGLGNLTSTTDNDYLLPQAKPPNTEVDPVDAEVSGATGSSEVKRKSKSRTKSRTTRVNDLDGEYLTNSNANPFLWNLAVLKYHRAKILEKLKRLDDAKKDWDWIKQNNFPPDDRLH